MNASVIIIESGNDTLYMDLNVRPSATLHVNAGYPFMMFRITKSEGYEYVTMNTNDTWHLRLYNKLHPNNNVKHTLEEIMSHVFTVSTNNTAPELIGSIFRCRIPLLMDAIDMHLSTGKIFQESPFLFKNIALNALP